MKTENLDINSLVLGTNDENNLFFIAIKANPESYDGCYFFDDKNLANSVLLDLREGSFKFSRIFGITWAALTCFFIIYMWIEAILKFRSYWSLLTLN